MLKDLHLLPVSVYRTVHMSTPVDELPSLSLASPWTPSNKGFPRGRGRGKVRYLKLESENLDEVPLISEGVEEGEGEGEAEKPAWNERQKWRHRLKSHSTFISWICDGGWQLLLKKWAAIGISVSIYIAPLHTLKSHSQTFSKSGNKTVTYSIYQYIIAV